MAPLFAVDLPRFDEQITQANTPTCPHDPLAHPFRPSRVWCQLGKPPDDDHPEGDFQEQYRVHVWFTQFVFDKANHDKPNRPRRGNGFSPQSPSLFTGLIRTATKTIGPADQLGTDGQLTDPL